MVELSGDHFGELLTFMWETGCRPQEAGVWSQNVRSTSTSVLSSIEEQKEIVRRLNMEADQRINNLRSA
jgi:hypothetical protein